MADQRGAESSADDDAAVAWRLLEAGSGPVHPLALADSGGRAT